MKATDKNTHSSSTTRSVRLTVPEPTTASESRTPTRHSAGHGRARSENSTSAGGANEKKKKKKGGPAFIN